MAKITEIATLGPDFDQLHAELEGLLHRIAMAQLLPAVACRSERMPIPCCNWPRR
ncbi:hypothetical protein RI537_04650 [Aeromonas salmonicida]|uniref:hypothetical protein n=1 Tax=Aeromonas salmonicida TaxID=645 RepID=UPI00343A4954